MRISFYEEIDALLGSRDSRYFGEGYLKTNYSIGNFKILDGAEGLCFSCVGSVHLPDLWSKKGETIQTPHLSTIDVIELSLESLRHLLHNTFHGKYLSATALKSISIVAGNSPVEESLGSVSVVGKVRQSECNEFLVDLSIANMDLQLEYSSKKAIGSPLISTSKQPIKVENIMALANDQRNAACGIVTPLSHHLNEAWSISSCFAAALQLGQTLLYELDGIKRSESNTLWMKRTKISLTQGLSPSSDLPQPIFVRLDNARRYTKADGEWRRADIYSLMCNASIVCSVTHKLP